MNFVTIRRAGLYVVVASAYWWTVFLAMHILEPEFNPITAPGSAYVLGAYGAWMTTTYFALSAALLSVARGISLMLPAKLLDRVAISVFVIAAAGAILAGLFPMDFPGPPLTLSGRLHVVGGMLTFPPWVIGALLVSMLVRRDAKWRSIARSVQLLSAAALGSLVLMIGSMRILGFAGYAQRLLLVLLFGWMIAVGLHFIRWPRIAAEQ